VTTSSDPEQIRREIERTQAALSQDVDALTEKVTPARSSSAGWTARATPRHG
jgi:hypothetical protein